ncbi:MAG: hypothetical protein COX62_03495 [Deltaproteobacteria bacterium CG_4_10_14_0_2_um_filter_43_8]|nr:MAG: hypothetical protein COV43_02175 [Deltaproteobacteria bacterium CG11_big_fil_rev_8_21_14_0_20_42_23]PJA21047.1 MAG: hypothetical protein COX62_03495 [Deltaproteobacteria bacterium CG_4_10_14_0_2_um_filter_43_8]PJC64736.1 MAG: hypothetical protein CO021_02710 [Deltaproteobacteria bacterium CG_4_9_14_0_2_um_filter_42_21]
MSLLLSPRVLNLATLRLENGMLTPHFPVATSNGVKAVPITRSHFSAVRSSVLGMDRGLMSLAKNGEEIIHQRLADRSAAKSMSPWYIDEASLADPDGFMEMGSIVHLAQKRSEDVYLGTTISYKHMDGFGLWISVGVRHDPAGIHLLHTTFIPEDFDNTLHNPFPSTQELKLQIRKDHLLEFILKKYPEVAQNINIADILRLNFHHVLKLARKFLLHPFSFNEVRRVILRERAPSGLLMLALASIFLEAEKSKVPSYLRELFIQDQHNSNTLNANDDNKYEFDPALLDPHHFDSETVFLASAATYLKPTTDMILGDGPPAEKYVLSMGNSDDGAALKIVQHSPLERGDEDEELYNINPAFVELAAMALGLAG